MSRISRVQRSTGDLIPQQRDGKADPTRFTCPVCQHITWNLNHVREGYCVICRKVTRKEEDDGRNRP